MLARLRRTLKITVFAIFLLSVNKVSTASDIPFGAAVRSATAIVNQTLREHGDDQVFVVRPNTDSVVFLIDGTGSMINKFATLKDEYTRTINGLRPEQSFDIVSAIGANSWILVFSPAPRKRILFPNSTSALDRLFFITIISPPDSDGGTVAANESDG